MRLKYTTFLVGLLGVGCNSMVHAPETDFDLGSADASADGARTPDRAPVGPPVGEGGNTAVQGLLAFDGEPLPPVPRLVRIGGSEYERLVSTVFSGPAAGPDDTPGELNWLVAPFTWTNPVDRFSTRNRSYSVDSNDFGRLAANAAEIAQRYLDQGNSCDLTSLQCQRDTLRQAAERAFSRPVSEAELDELMGVSSSTDNTARLIERLSAVFLNPNFVFRSERGTPESNEPSRLQPYELAAALAFTVTGHPPDKVLIDATPALDDDAAYLAQVDRLLGSEAHRERVFQFVREYFQYDEAVNSPRDIQPKNYYEGEEGANGLQYAPKELVEDTDALVRALIVESLESEFLATLLTTPKAFVQRSTAFYYDVDSDSDGPAPVTLEGETPRQGLLSQPSWLVKMSEPDHNSPIKRGLWIQESLLCGDVPDVPIEGVPFLEIGGRPLRDALAEHLDAGASCALCHQFLDPLAMPLEQFDLFGRYRTEEEGAPVRVDGTLAWSEGVLDISGPVSNPSELVAALSSSREAIGCFLAHAFEFWLGRDISEGDYPAIQDAYLAYSESGGNFNAALRSMLTSYSFTTRAPKN